MRTLLAAVDFSEVSEAVVRLAVREAQLSNGQLHLLHVSQRSEALSEFEEERNELLSLAARCDVERTQLETEVVHGDPGIEILAAIERVKPDLVVVGSHGHGAIYDAVVGSVAEMLLRKSPCPVLVVPPLRLGE